MSAYVLAVANQKGGVAKTTSVVTLAAAFAEKGLRVLVLDLDAQACLTFSVGVDPESVETSIYEVLTGASGIAGAVVAAEEGFDVVPAVIDLAAAESVLLPREDRFAALVTVLAPVMDRYDVVLLDCSPSLGVLTLAALTAADGLVIPMPAEMLGHRGVGQLLDTVADVQRTHNPRLKVVGILPTLYDGRSNHGRAVVADVGERFGVPVLTPIPRTVRFAEAPALGRSVLSTARRSRAAAAYREVADSIVASEKLPRKGVRRARTRGASSSGARSEDR